MIAGLVIIGIGAVAAAFAVVVLAPRHDVLVARRSAERPAPMLTATLTPSHRALAGRPSAAGTAAPVHVITDARERTTR